MGSYTLPRRQAAGLVYRKAKGRHGIGPLRARAIGLRAFFARKKTRTV